MVFLTRYEESIKSRPWLTFKQRFDNLIEQFFEKPLLPLQFFPTHISSSSSFVKKLSKFFVFQTLLFCRKPKCAISFHSPLPLPKRIQQGLIAWILFVSLFFLFKKNEGLTSWILLCLPSPFSRVFLLILPFPLTKDFKGLTTWDIFCFSLQRFKGLTT